MAALARLTIVVEAADPSGSLITAAFAGHLGREVGAVPGRVTARMAAGANLLLRDGASVIRTAEDALDELYGVGSGRRGWREEEWTRWLPESAVRREAGRDGPETADERPPAALDAGLRRVLDAVEAGEDPPGIGRASGLAPGAVRAALGRLEALGLLVPDGLGGYERRPGR